MVRVNSIHTYGANVSTRTGRSTPRRVSRLASVIISISNLFASSDWAKTISDGDVGIFLAHEKDAGVLTVTKAVADSRVELAAVNATTTAAVAVAVGSALLLPRPVFTILVGMQLQCLR